MSAFDPSLLAMETERLRLRPLNADDDALYHDLYTDPVTMRFIGPPLSAEKAAVSFRKVLALQGERSLGARLLVIDHKAQQKSVGICGTSAYDAEAFRVEVGIVLRPEAGARGIAREALAGVMKKIFSISPVNEIWVECSTLDPAVERLITAIGFTPCGSSKEVMGSLSKRFWSVRRSSWHVVRTTA